ncbi:hypothetical protein [Acuticoccus sp. I52.16.1]|uniref:hypothetical protein n=1 Tax=Acuticoccus sp. I52.16.1 TaxID=2928472 RepID=UPI001FD5204E|nr:hypothetical protein [Acuticoccus sp. I52.16.1]UOM34670.1 hypothetical protein MRB58_00180 [Acuticoccus sp. I52.16.1]
MRRLAGPALLALALALAEAGPALGEPAPAHPLAGLTRENVAAARERPLFAPTRRPPAAKPRRVTLPASPVLTQPELQLIGVVEMGGRSIAIVSALDTEETLTLHTGAHVGPWSVEAITPGGVTLREGDRRVVLELFEPDRERSEDEDPPAEATPYPRHALSDVSSDMLMKILRGEARIENP